MLACDGVRLDRRFDSGQRGSTRSVQTSWIVRLGARLRSRRLDCALIAGADPAHSAEVAVHAARLTTRAARGELADSLERLARSDTEPRTYGRVLPFRRAVRANATELHALAALLRGSTPVDARGVAMLRRLVRDGTGAAYTDRYGGALARQLSSARAAATG